MRKCLIGVVLVLIAGFMIEYLICKGDSKESVEVEDDEDSEDDFYEDSNLDLTEDYTKLRNNGSVAGFARGVQK